MIRSLDKVAIARVVLTSREHLVALEARDKGLMATPPNILTTSRTSRSPRNLAKHIVEQKAGISSQINSRIVTKPRCRNCWRRSRRACPLPPRAGLGRPRPPSLKRRSRKPLRGVRQADHP